jgi:hypothetical protein
MITRDDFSRGQIRSVNELASNSKSALESCCFAEDQLDRNIPDMILVDLEKRRQRQGKDDLGYCWRAGWKREESADRRQRGFRLLFLSPFLNPNVVCAPTSISGE